MKSKILVIVIIFFTLLSCKPKKDAPKIEEIQVVEATNEQIKPEGYNLLRNNCYACHSVTTKSHDEIIAPPMVAIKKRYKVSFKTKTEFTEAVVNWVLDPKKEHALMYGAVHKFKVMPKQPFDKIAVIKIAEYIFNNKLEKPDWFDSNFKEEHLGGLGNGKGRGKRMGKN
ncbi:MAG: hypothetical protein QM495_03365 [Lutibacter sp.]|uniref:c-type cytochrome n=1 Tax=Lutibacter sp. TaxID=1925666 RepID=UPI00385F5609